VNFDISTTAGEFDKVFYMTFGVCLFFFVSITVTAVCFLVLYNHKRNPVPAKTSGSLPLEIAWTIIPTIIAIIMFYYGVVGYKVARNAPAGAFQVTVIGRQWQWLFQYPNNRVATELRLPAGEPVLLNLVSRDVIHSFYVPAFRVKEDVVPGRTNIVSFTPLMFGTYDVLCSQYCGLSHADMRSRVIVMNPKDFDEWYKKPEVQKPIDLKAAFAGTPDQIKRGGAVYELNCANCHGLKGDGSGLPTARNFTKIDGWKNGTKLSQMFVTVTEGVAGTQMQPFSHLPADDRFAVIHYEQTFAKGHPKDTPEDIAELDERYELSKGSVSHPEIAVFDAMRRISVPSAPRAPSAPPEEEAILWK
jgi:cytochrome c oxidase subunit 2